MSNPYLFDDLADEIADDETALSTRDEAAVPVYTSPIEQATFDVMELVDAFFRASFTVEEYDTMQKNVKKILLEAFDDREKETPRRALISHPDD